MADRGERGEGGGGGGGLGIGDRRESNGQSGNWRKGRECWSIVAHCAVCAQFARGIRGFASWEVKADSSFVGRRDERSRGGKV